MNMPFFANATLTIIIAVVAVAALAVVGYYVTRMMKGKIELDLPKTGFNTGESVTGRVTLTTKKSLELRRLFVALIGYEEIESRDHDRDGQSRTEKREIYRDECNLEGGKSIAAGFNQSYEFALTAPGVESVGTQGNMGMNISLGPITLGGSDRRRLVWKLEARADLPGVDIAKSRRVTINVS